MVISPLADEWPTQPTTTLRYMVVLPQAKNIEYTGSEVALIYPTVQKRGRGRQHRRSPAEEEEENGPGAVWFLEEENFEAVLKSVERQRLCDSLH